MKTNLGSADRVVRVVVALGMATCAVLAPLPPLVRLLTFGVGAVYMLGTALVGTCLGYRLMGRSTCPVDAR